MARPGKGDMFVKIVSFRTKKKRTSAEKKSAVTEKKSVATAKKRAPAAATKSRAAGSPPPAARRRRKKRNLRPLAVVGALLLLVALAVAVQQTIFSGWLHREDAHLTYIDGIPVHEDFLPEGYAARPGEKRAIRYVVIHETDNQNAGADAEAHNSFMHTNGQDHELSWHYTVDDHEIWHHIPDDETAFHAGDHMDDGGGNKNGIGVEMCVNADGDYETTLQNAQKLVAALLHEYGLSMDDLKKHQDFSGKNCPSRLLDAGRWEEFKQGVERELAALEDA